MKTTFLLLIFFFFSLEIYSQENKKPTFVKKPIKTDSEINASNNSNETIQNILSYKNANKKKYVSINNKFFSMDTLSKIKNLEDYEIDVINIPENITKDIVSIIILKKVVK